MNLFIVATFRSGQIYMFQKNIDQKSKLINSAFFITGDLIFADCVLICLVLKKATKFFMVIILSFCLNLSNFLPRWLLLSLQRSKLNISNIYQGTFQNLFKFRELSSLNKYIFTKDLQVVYGSYFIFQIKVIHGQDKILMLQMLQNAIKSQILSPLIKKLHFLAKSIIFGNHHKENLRCERYFSIFRIQVLTNRMSLKFMEEGWPLQKFESKPPCSPFDDAQGTLPNFLVENLVDPNRIIKCFRSDTQASIRIFCFQYLKLCFEMQQADYETYISKIQDILTNEHFIFHFPEHKDGSFYNQQQFKRLIIQFLEYIDNEQVSIDNAYKRYPIMDQVLITLVRSILLEYNKCQSFDDYIPREELFDFLSSYFCVDIALYDNCLKFIDSDVFIYEQDPQQVYMVYIDYEKQPNDGLKQDIIQEKQVSEDISSVKQVQQGFSNMKIQEQESQVNKYQKQKQYQDNSAASEQVDYTYSKKSQNIQQLQRQQFKLSIQSSISQDNLDLKPAASLAYNVNVISQSAELMNQFKSSDILPNSDRLFQDKNQKSIWSYTQSVSNRPSVNKSKLLQIYQIDQLDNFSSKQNSNYSFQRSYEDKFFTQFPRQFGTPILNKISQDWNKETKYSGIKNFNEMLSTQLPSIKSQETKNNQKYSNYNYLKNISKQFTNSILLKQIIEPYSTNIHMMKTRARAQRKAIGISTLYQY